MLDDELKKQYKSAMDNEKPSGESLLRLNKTMAQSVERKVTEHAYRRLLPLAAGFILLAVLTVPLMSYISRSNPKANLNDAIPIPEISSEAATGSGAQAPAAAPTSTPLSSNITENGYLPTPVVSDSKALGGGSFAEAGYDKLFGVINELRSKNDSGSRMYATGSIASEKSSLSAPVSNQANAKSFSNTNIQVAGVQESDIVKTDGQYIYAYSSDKLNIIKADNGSFTKMSELPRTQKNEDGKQSGNAFEMYVEGDRLIVLRNTHTYRIMAPQAPAVSDSKAYSMPYYSKNFVAADIYDISDKSTPQLLNSFSQDGGYVSSRMIDGVLYLVSNSYINGEISVSDPSTFVPQVYKNNEPCLIAPDDIEIGIDPKKTSGIPQYLLLCGIDTKGDGNLVSDKSVLGYGNQVYASKTNLYVTAYSSFEEGGTVYGETKLYRFSLNGGNMSLKAEGSVPGVALNQFSMDEYKDVFRIVTTVNSYSYVTAPSATVKSSTGVAVQSSQYNCLYTLDSNLFIIGKIEKLASGERVYSVRFDGDIGYFVTFRQVDPLFAVDLSTPTSPKVLSALKIPGFSQYLHPYSDSLLFGLGRNADEQSGRAGFLKLSMFDVSDPKNVTEKSKLIIDGVDYSEASYNHKAIIVDSSKNIIAFPADGKYLIYSYSSTSGFKQEAALQSFNGSEYSYSTRGLYIGDYFYVVTNNGITSYSIGNYKPTSEIAF